MFRINDDGTTSVTCPRCEGLVVACHDTATGETRSISCNTSGCGWWASIRPEHVREARRFDKYRRSPGCTYIIPMPGLEPVVRFKQAVSRVIRRLPEDYDASDLQPACDVLDHELSKDPELEEWYFGLPDGEEKESLDTAFAQAVEGMGIRW